jgi:ferredoxin-NADP reductase/mono/diheme cytochrome c family protein
MLNSSTSVWLGVTFVLVGAINVWLILQTSARVRDTKASTRLIAAHRVGGYVFIALFCVMGYYMLARLGDVSGGAPPGTMIHLTLAMILSPLLFVKVLIARYYKSYYSLLMPIGLVIFVLSFVLIGITAGPSLARHANTQTVSLEAIGLPAAAIDIGMAAATMEKRCSKCHSLDRLAGARKDARGWLATVSRMKALPDSGISEDDSRVIVSYLASQMAPRGPVAAASLEVARALVDQRCGRCHGLDRVYRATETQDEWKSTVTRMVGFAEGSANAFQPGEDQQIIAYLSATQTPDALDRKKTRIAAFSPASPASENIVTQEASSAPGNSAPRSRYDSKMIGFISLVCFGILALIIRRPDRAVPPSAISGTRAGSVKTPAGTVVTAASSASGPLILKLASITAQTSDAKTLRFILPNDRKLNARPGQFLTFTFLFDGKKVVRSYSICSSTARSSYVEITPKRVSQGCVSVFLNDQASIGLTVEASGAFGQFCFDENKHRDVVLLAAGSGITPMMSMLRYMDDLCLETAVTLLYCVRTSSDVIFHKELEELRASLKNFRYHLLLSQPHAKWSGARGYINREFIEDTVKEPASRDFFLCGPPPFMEASRDILIDLGVKPDRISQESFGSGSSKSAAPAQVAAEPGVLVEFVRSGKTFTVPS